MLLLLAGLALGAAWALLRPGDPKTEPGVPREVSAAELRSFAGTLNHEVYWAGPRPATKLELTKTSGGAVFVRYLSDEAPVGDRRPAFTTVATYRMRDAYEVARRAARRRGASSRKGPGGYTAVWNHGTPGSVYLAYPRSDVLVEVYEPSATQARELALSGEVGPVR